MYKPFIAYIVFGLAVFKEGLIGQVQKSDTSICSTVCRGFFSVMHFIDLGYTLNKLTLKYLTLI